MANSSPASAERRSRSKKAINSKLNLDGLLSGSDTDEQRDQNVDDVTQTPGTPNTRSVVATPSPATRERYIRSSAAAANIDMANFYNSPMNSRIQRPEETSFESISPVMNEGPAGTQGPSLLLREVSPESSVYSTQHITPALTPNAKQTTRKQLSKCPPKKKNPKKKDPKKKKPKKKILKRLVKRPVVYVNDVKGYLEHIREHRGIPEDKVLYRLMIDYGQNSLKYTMSVMHKDASATNLVAGESMGQRYSGI